MEKLNYNFINELIKYIETNIPIVFLQGYEKDILDAINFIERKKIIENIFEYSLATEGTNSEKVIKLTEIEEIKGKVIDALQCSFEEGKSTLLVIHGFETYLNNSTEELVDILNRAAQLTNYNKFSSNLTVIFSGKDYEIPILLRENSLVIKKPMPNYTEVREIVFSFIENNDLNIKKEEEEKFIKIIYEKTNGLNESEITELLRFVYYDNGIQLFKKIDGYIDILEQEIRKFKVQKLIKLRTLSIENSNVSFSDISGLENLKKYIEKKRVAINSYSQLNQYNISMPKGILLLGEPGTGKSLSAKAIANHMNLELIKFDISQILGKYVGESEKRMKDTLETVQYMSPCVLWIDEIEKAFAGVNKDNNEIMRKVFGQLLTWMSENDKGTYVIATANNIDGVLPPEFLRKGRFDEIFYIDRPTKEERRDILKLHLSKRKINYKYIEENYSEEMDRIVDLSENLVGADLEYCCNEFALYYHFNEETKDDDLIFKVKKSFEVMEREVKEIRDRNQKKGVFINLNDELIRLKEEFSSELKSIQNSDDNDDFALIVKKVIKNNISEKVSQVVESITMKSQNIKTYKSATLPKEK